MYYLKFINVLFALFIKIYECVNRFVAYILELIKQIISNALHNIGVKRS